MIIPFVDRFVGRFGDRNTYLFLPCLLSFLSFHPSLLCFNDNVESPVLHSFERIVFF